MKKWLFILLIGLLPMIARAVDPPWTQSPKYISIRYFYNEYTRQQDGVYYGAVTSTDSLRLNGQLASYYATASGLSGEITNRQTADNNLQNQITAGATTYAIRSDVATSTATLTTNYNNLYSSWTTTDSRLTAVQQSTFTVSSLTISTGQVTGNWYPNYMQAGTIPKTVTLGQLKVLLSTASAQSAGTIQAVYVCDTSPAISIAPGETVTIAPGSLIIERPVLGGLSSLGQSSVGIYQIFSTSFTVINRSQYNTYTFSWSAWVGL